MFLLYLAEGERRYGTKPLAPYARKAWAFQFNLGGNSSMMVRHEGAMREERLEGDYATVAGPGCVHGWSGRPGDRCNVLVFQFDEADYPLHSAIGQDGWRCLRISAGEVRAAQALFARCAAARDGSRFLAPMEYQIVASELALLLLKRLPAAELGSPPDFVAKKVASALAWYEANLAGAPTVREVADAMHLSPAHLRRLFHRTRHLSPQAAFTRVQFERALELMRDPAVTLEHVAESAGFGSASAFSRAFKARFRLPPKDYRARLV